MYAKIKEILDDGKPKYEEATEEGKTPFLEMVRRSLQTKADLYNAGTGTLNLDDGIDCPLCKNKGYTEKVIVGYGGGYTSVMQECECQKQRRSWKRLQNSGLADSIQRMTFDSYKADQEWQVKAKLKAEKFARGEGGEWFYFGGAVGSGKTHLCTAICGELLKQNQSVKYMCWAEEAVKLKGKVNDDDYDSLIRPYKDADVLYIDDFFKTRRNKTGIAEYPSDADVKLAYQIINFRYISRKKTIISSEWLMNELMQMDEATASRIYEMAKGSTLQLGRDEKRNYRNRDAM